ncbi:glycosyltransferase involved in cell wall biosynthesis [Tahibacter aquaticus]|uniref:Glycosyltransferase involved in cell wall biosynthesis n=2 Tax=Tahibacter aquaticus TaxID=520092 RepID=A0A4R6YML6_9GAMM|nr:glycosyltransferase involved in cell wall biosynthesis [Tahibacter aquaticus]
MNVLFLTKYPIEGASSRYRVYQYLPYLDAAGIAYRVQPFMATGMYRAVNRRGGAPLKALHTAWATVRRVAAALSAGSYDLVFLQRECLPFGAPWLERALHRRGVPLIFDYDDALFLFKPNPHTPLADAFKRPHRLLEIFRLADCVLAGNEWLRARAGEHCADARTFHVAEDLQRHTPRTTPRDRSSVVLGWLGSPSTEKYLDLIREPLRALSRKHAGLRLRIVGGGRFADAQIAVEHVPWDLDTELAQLHDFDIGLMPLPLEEWSLGKSGGKARTYMAMGLPAVCTGIGFNCELIRDGETGFLVRESQDWHQVLERLIESPGLRKRVGTAARQAVEERFSLQQQGPRFVEILREVAARGRSH